jgi:hypothetical protein
MLLILAHPRRIAACQAQSSPNTVKIHVLGNSRLLRITQNVASFYQKVGHAEKMSGVARQANSRGLVETSDSQQNSVVFVIRMAPQTGLSRVANPLVGNDFLR